jgi:hypothetical protein
VVYFPQARLMNLGEKEESRLLENVIAAKKPFVVPRQTTGTL